MDRIKATYDFGDGNNQPVTIIGTMSNGHVICVHETGTIKTHPPEYVTVDAAAFSVMSDATWLAERIDLLVREIQSIQTYGLRLNK